MLLVLQKFELFSKTFFIQWSCITKVFWTKILVFTNFILCQHNFKICQYLFRLMVFISSLMFNTNEGLPFDKKILRFSTLVAASQLFLTFFLHINLPCVFFIPFLVTPFFVVFCHFSCVIFFTICSVCLFIFYYSLYFQNSVLPILLCSCILSKKSKQT